MILELSSSLDDSVVSEPGPAASNCPAPLTLSFPGGFKDLLLGTGVQLSLANLVHKKLVGFLPVTWVWGAQLNNIYPAHFKEAALFISLL